MLVHRLDGRSLLLNPDLIETVESVAPATRVTLVDGRVLEVIEPPTAIAARVREFRAAVLVEAERQSGRGVDPASGRTPGAGAGLRPVPTAEH